MILTQGPSPSSQWWGDSEDVIPDPGLSVSGGNQPPGLPGPTPPVSALKVLRPSKLLVTQDRQNALLSGSLSSWREKATTTVVDRGQEGVEF